jgi:hypothetical protein
MNFETRQNQNNGLYMFDILKRLKHNVGEREREREA